MRSAEYGKERTFEHAQRMEGGDLGDRETDKKENQSGAAQADRVGDVVEFLAGDFFEAFAFGGELFVDFNGFFGELLVGFLGAAEQGEVWTSGDPFVAVGIQTDAEHDGLAARVFFLRRFAHVLRVVAGRENSKGKFGGRAEGRTIFEKSLPRNGGGVRGWRGGICCRSADRRLRGVEDRPLIAQ